VSSFDPRPRGRSRQNRTKIGGGGAEIRPKMAAHSGRRHAAHGRTRGAALRGRPRPAPSRLVPRTPRVPLRPSCALAGRPTTCAAPTLREPGPRSAPRLDAVSAPIRAGPTPRRRTSGDLGPLARRAHLFRTGSARGRARHRVGVATARAGMMAAKVRSQPRRAPGQVRAGVRSGQVGVRGMPSLEGSARRKT